MGKEAHKSAPRAILENRPHLFLKHSFQPTPACSAAASCQLAQSGARRTERCSAHAAASLEGACQRFSVCQPRFSQDTQELAGMVILAAPSRSRGSIATQWGWQTAGQAASEPPNPQFLGKNPNVFSLLRLTKLVPEALVT